MKLIGLIFITISVRLANTEECTTPNNEKANCISLYSCPVLLKGLATALEEQLEFVRKSNCGGTGANPMVCCGTASNFVKINNSTAPDIPDRDLLASNKICGLQHSDDYFHDQIRTVITDSPWLAHIEYDRYGERVFLCAGSLINNRYILTAAHCAITCDADPIGVRLGEYSVKNTTDCSDYFGESECSHPAKDFSIYNITIHPDYNRQNRINDIALLRLNTTVTYSDYIRPVCLSSSATNSPKIGDLVLSSGWGAKQFGSEKADIKKKIRSKVISNEKCQGIVAKHRNIVRLMENHFCVIDAENSFENICQGDSGAPVIYKHRAQWYQEGVVSFGIGCGSNELTVLERVPHHLEWIVKNIKP